MEGSLLLNIQTIQNWGISLGQRLQTKVGQPFQSSTLEEDMGLVGRYRAIQCHYRIRLQMGPNIKEHGRTEDRTYGKKSS